MSIKIFNKIPFSVLTINLCLIVIILLCGLYALILFGIMGYLGSIHEVEMMIWILSVIAIGIVPPIYLFISLLKKRNNVKKLMIIYSFVLLTVVFFHQYSIFQDKRMLSREDYSRLEHLSKEEIKKLPEGCKPREATDYGVGELIILMISFFIPIYMLLNLFFSKKVDDYINTGSAQPAASQGPRGPRGL